MAIWDIIKSIVGNNSQETLFSIEPDTHGLSLVLPTDLMDHCQLGSASPWLLNQFIHLQMLTEEGIAEPRESGFFIFTEEAVRLENDLKYLLQFPPPWPGQFNVSYKNHTTSNGFDIALQLIDTDGEKTECYQVKGPLIILAETEIYLPSIEQWIAIEAIEKHKMLSTNERSEYANLLAIDQLQQAKQAGATINLRHFNDIDTLNPKQITVSGLTRDNGDLELVPTFDGLTDIDAIRTRLWQVTDGHQATSIRVKNKIVLLNEKKLKATQEIINHNIIPKEQIATFLKTPSAFLNAALVDLDSGFSLRVLGATKFKHAYFGDTDEANIDWFSSKYENTSIIMPNKLESIIKSEDELTQFNQLLVDAQQSGAEQIVFKKHTVDVSDTQAIQQAIIDISEQLNARQDEKHEADEVEETASEFVTTVVDIKDNDLEVNFGKNNNSIQASYEDDIDWKRYKRTPFHYQETGIRWILGLAEPSLNEVTNQYGGLLADDMGLGKTFMSLVAISEYQSLLKKKAMTECPVLVVAPLSLLATWQKEAELTYHDSPFDDIVVLQSNADLNQFKVTGASIETHQAKETDLDNIRYALKVGSHYGNNRLDQPRRLILTTYQAMRDYQFSLCRIDWSMVIFDEAQLIKNPNTLASRAAKALKAKFKLVATGTPVENSLCDFWCLMDTAIPGLLGSYQDFRKTYVQPILSAKDDQRQRKEQIGKQLRQHVGAFMLRRIKEDQLEGLPTKTIYVGDREAMGTEKYMPEIYCTMQSEQHQRYDTVVSYVNEQQMETSGNVVLQGLHRLRDLSLHPKLMDQGKLLPPTNRKEAKQSIEQSAKLKHVFKLLEQVKERDEKVIIFLINKRLQAFLKVACERIFDITVAIINGDTQAIAKKSSTETRQSMIQAFEKKTGFGIIIMSPVAAGMGLTVVAANNVIHLERHWNPAKEAQATDRVYRIGQTRAVNVYLPILQHPDLNINSFDVNLNRLLNQKCALKDAIITPETATGSEMSVTFGHGVKQAITTKFNRENLTQLTWQQFEALTAELLAKSYTGEAQLTQQGADGGIDVVIRSKTKNLLVQCKHTSRNKKMRSQEALKELVYARTHYNKAFNQEFDTLVFVTNAKNFSTKVKSAANQHEITLIDLISLSKLLDEYPVTERDILTRLDKPRLAI